MDISTIINEGQTSLGIELGSTRIKAVLTDKHGRVIATGGYEWENQLIDGVWTYSLDEVHNGLRACYKDLVYNVKARYDIALSNIGAIGISAMMHGYLVFDKDNKLLTPFRTWRNTMTSEAVGVLSELFNFNIPQRWSIAHLYQSILNNDEHVKDIAYMTTLSGYVHWLLTGEKVLGIDDASGMFPIDKEGRFNQEMLEKFDSLIEKENYDLILLDVMLPGISGFELMDYIRDLGTPVIFITAKNAVSDRVKGLRMGAEDYIVKPFDILELQARVEGVLRRHGKLETTISVGGVQINTMAMTVCRNGEEIPLTKKEYDIALELHVQRMKKKLGWENFVKPVFAIGYRLEV